MEPYINAIFVFLSVIFGGLISLAGVYFTLRWNLKLHEKNLREERRKIKEERGKLKVSGTFFLIHLLKFK